MSAATWLAVSYAVIGTLSLVGQAQAAPPATVDGAWVLDAQATEKGFIDQPPTTRLDTDFAWSEMNCELGWLVDPQTLRVGPLGSGAPREFPREPSAPDTRIYSAVKEGIPVKLRLRGEHLIVQFDDDELSARFRWKRVPKDALWLAPSDATVRECKAALQRTYDRFRK